ncbi:hypothetical protein Suden_1497 [Sulfurimonas denitrificans DSM 1251]|uniref:Uncharacterized protein n=1 Tax=Sulfurimonas denitrificans (strain ATCC 33889 / DSM 1251) TaxID=326298 RepID=Q30QF7_SULDN|nr:hypothetical protein [Sulfurimonas denitrificans]ABB44774.1 hypothetical protein Suden_1497 [Sulfurimonas denitrificans DSM 1251]MDD3443690.1 hypothetical protein [Sulfurimonas denitrificans]
MASQKAIDNSLRLRYIRALERFHKSILSYLLTTQNITKESYSKKVQNSQKVLNRVEEIDIYKGDLQDLQKIVKKIISYQDSDKEIEEIKDDILYISNQLEKTKNSRRYKKEKHSSSIYDEWE